MPGTIVVGVDGSPGSERALRWAAEEARLRSARLRVLHASRVPFADSVPEPYLVGIPAPHIDTDAVADAYRTRARHLLDTEVDEVLGPDPQLEVDRAVVEGAAAAALLEAAEDADLLVVGSRGRGGFAGLLLGSVSHHCAQHAACPVVIVRQMRRATRS